MLSLRRYALWLNLCSKRIPEIDELCLLGVILRYLSSVSRLRDCFGRSFEKKQLSRLDEIFSQLRSAKLKLKPSKCALFQRSVEFLGHDAFAEGIAMQDEKISAIRDWTPCRNITKIREFMGLSGYYRRFVKNVSIIAAPFYALTKKNAKFC